MTRAKGVVERTYIGDSLYVWWDDGNLMLAVSATEDTAGNRPAIYFRPQSVERLRAFLSAISRFKDASELLHHGHVKDGVDVLDAALAAAPEKHPNSAAFQQLRDALGLLINDIPMGSVTPDAPPERSIPCAHRCGDIKQARRAWADAQPAASQQAVSPWVCEGPRGEQIIEIDEDGKMSEVPFPQPAASACPTVERYCWRCERALTATAYTTCPHCMADDPLGARDERPAASTCRTCGGAGGRYDYPVEDSYAGIWVPCPDPFHTEPRSSQRDVCDECKRHGDEICFHTEPRSPGGPASCRDATGSERQDSGAATYTRDERPEAPTPCSRCGWPSVSPQIVPCSHHGRESAELEAQARSGHTPAPEQAWTRESLAEAMFIKTRAWKPTPSLTECRILADLVLSRQFGGVVAPDYRAGEKVLMDWCENVHDSKEMLDANYDKVVRAIDAALRRG